MTQQAAKGIAPKRIRRSQWRVGSFPAYACEPWALHYKYFLLSVFDPRIEQKIQEIDK